MEGGVLELQVIDLFKGVSGNTMAAVKASCQFQRYEACALLITQDDNTDDVFYVLDGKVCAKSYSPAGKEVAFLEMKAGEVFGEFAAIDGLERSASIEALEPSLVARQSGSAFRDLVKTNGEFALAVARLLVGKNRSLSQRVFEVSTLNVSQRVAAEILRLAVAVAPDCLARSTQEPIVVEAAPSHHEIATRLSTHREAVSRAIAALATKDIIKAGRRSFTVLNAAALRDQAYCLPDDMI